MPVPPNQTAATAIDIGTLTGYTPYTTTQDAWDGAAAVQLWYSYLPVAGDDMLEVYAYGNGTTNLPGTTIRSGPPPASTTLDNSNSSQSRPIQQDIVTFVTPGEMVFFRFFPNNVNPAVITIRIARGQKELIVDEDLFINDSSPGYPGIIMGSTNAIPKKYELNYPAGEGQQVLTNGIVGVIDEFNLHGVVLYDVVPTGFTVRATPTMPDTHYTNSLSTNQIDTFWATRRFGVGNSFAVAIDQDGVVGAPLDLGFDSIEDVVPQADNSALYCIRSTEIKKITNPSGVGTTFLTVDATFNFGNNLLMLTDDTLLLPYEKAATIPYVKQFDLSATLLNTITLTPVGTTGTLERLFHDPSDTEFFWIWWQDSVQNHFVKYKISDGSVVTSLARNKFIESVSQTTILAADTVYSGADFSCAPIVLRVASGNTAASGLYILSGTGSAMGGASNPIIRHDVNWIDVDAGTSENVEIPDPYYDTYLAGDE